MTGAIQGVRFGEVFVPSYWKDLVEGKETVLGLADKLFHLRQKKLRRKEETKKAEIKEDVKKEKTGKKETKKPATEKPVTKKPGAKKAKTGKE